MDCGCRVTGTFVTGLIEKQEEIALASSLPDTAVCLHCGYSLRGLPDNVCPECGRAFDPAEPRSYWDSTWPRTVRLWRHWAGPLPAWHPVLTVVFTLVFVDGLSFFWLPDAEVAEAETIVAGAFLAGLLLSYCLRRHSRIACFANRYLAALVDEVTWRHRVLHICAYVGIACLGLSPVLGPVRVLVSLPFMEYKARQINNVMQADNHCQLVGLLLVRRIGCLGGPVKFELVGLPSRAVRYYPFTVSLPKDRRLLLTRWEWMEW